MRRPPAASMGRHSVRLLLAMNRDHLAWPFFDEKHRALVPGFTEWVTRQLDRFRQARPVWDRCAEYVLRAAQSGDHADIAEATRCLEVALGRENWLKGHA